MVISRLRILLEVIVEIENFNLLWPFISLTFRTQRFYLQGSTKHWLIFPFCKIRNAVTVIGIGGHDWSLILSIHILFVQQHHLYSHWFIHYIVWYLYCVNKYITVKNECCSTHRWQSHWISWIWCVHCWWSVV